MVWKTSFGALAPAPATPDEAARRLLARALRRSAAVMTRWARVLRLAARGRHAVAADPVLEFHAEAGAPEGALYVDGELVGRLEGVKRL